MPIGHGFPLRICVLAIKKLQFKLILKNYDVRVFDFPSTLNKKITISWKKNPVLSL